MAKLDVAELR